MKDAAGHDVQPRGGRLLSSPHLKNGTIVQAASADEFKSFAAFMAAITALLKDNGRSGVPLYLYYAPGAARPVILPQILTESGVLAAIGG